MEIICNEVRISTQVKHATGRFSTLKLWQTSVTGRCLPTKPSYRPIDMCTYTCSYFTKLLNIEHNTWTLLNEREDIKIQNQNYTQSLNSYTKSQTKLKLNKWKYETKWNKMKMKTQLHDKVIKKINWKKLKKRKTCEFK